LNCTERSRTETLTNARVLNKGTPAELEERVEDLWTEGTAVDASGNKA
jgi:hypothetical protein